MIDGKTGKPLCDSCGGQWVESRDYRQVTGFERASRNGAGGTNALRARQPGHALACASCVDKVAKGLVGQTSLC